MSLLPKTQDHLDIIDIKDDVVILTGGRYRMVVETTAVNFDLLSEDEQNSAIYAYASLVNSLDYPIQILVRTRQVDITNYINFLRRQLKEQPSSAMKEQLGDYITFVEQLVLENTVLQKKFYVVLPYMNTSTNQPNLFDSIISSLPFSKSKTAPKGFTEDSVKKAKLTLTRRIEDLQWQFRRLGIQITALPTEELIRLFYEIYNPEAGENSGLRQDPYGYTTPIVRSSLTKEARERESNEEKPEPHVPQEQSTEQPKAPKDIKVSDKPQNPT